LTRSLRTARALVRAASAFWSVLARRPQPSRRLPTRTLPSRDRQGADAPRPYLPPELPSPGVENRCPVCQARFRGARICSRCGADLEPLMMLAVQAWQLRQAARQALEAGDVERALGLATQAQGIQDTGSGEALRLLGAWLQAVGAPR
jgi:hypothetical protein